MFGLIQNWKTFSSMILVVLAAGRGDAAVPALMFEDARPLMSGGTAINIGNHAAVRLVDWNSDGLDDLLVAGGDGHLWLFRQNNVTRGIDFEPGIQLADTDGIIRVGTGYTGACLADMNGDGLPDLVAAGNDNQVRCYANIGTPGNPEFAPYNLVQSDEGFFTLPASVGGRIDVVDWNHDGLKDLLTGSYGGVITWYENTGTRSIPVLSSSGKKIYLHDSPLCEAYNIHPCSIDFNEDGLLDIAFGINWGYVKVLLNTEGVGTTRFSRHFKLCSTNGKALNIRSLIGDDTIPAFADLNGDHTLDLVSGGLNGKLFFMAGVPYSNQLNRIDAIMESYQDNLGAALKSDDKLRETLFGLHYGIRTMAVSFLPAADREYIRDWYHQHISRYPQFFKKRNLKQDVHAYVPYLAGQVWINTFESMPDTPQHREETAAVCGFTGIHSNLLVDLGIIYVENSRSTPASQQALYDIVASIPEPLQIVETVTEDAYLCPGKGKSKGIGSRKGVNVFSGVGEYSEGFPAEVPETRVDGFSVLTAHELNHNVELAAGAIYPWFWNRKYELLEQAAPPDLVFLDHENDRFGLDIPATQARFLKKGYWDGDKSHWEDAYLQYWKTGAGAGYERHWLRDNLRFCIHAPQEAYATLANQYFTSSEVMLELAMERWKQGITNCINQVLFFIDSYSLGSDQSWFYRIDTDANVTRTPVKLRRNERGHIDGITLTNQRYKFSLDEKGNVLKIYHAANR